MCYLNIVFVCNILANSSKENINWEKCLNLNNILILSAAKFLSHLITSLKYKIVDVTCSLEEIVQHIIKTNLNKKTITLVPVAINNGIQIPLLTKFRENIFWEESNISEIIEYISVRSSSNCNHNVRSKKILINFIIKF